MAGEICKTAEILRREVAWHFDVDEEGRRVESLSPESVERIERGIAEGRSFGQLRETIWRGAGAERDELSGWWSVVTGI